MEFRRDLWRQKTRVPWVSYGIVRVILGLVVLVENRLVTDRQMEGQTHDDGEYRASIASRGLKPAESSNA